MPIRKLQPERIWNNFYSLTQIPRPSGHTKKVADFLVKFGKDLGLESYKDECGNVIIRKPATPGMENRKGIVMQAHMDMVPQKNNDKVHDFTKDPIETRIVKESDGDWVYACGTTLGADDGLGVAAAMSVLESKTIKHGPIEALFTVDEETRMVGAKALKAGELKGEILLNLDSETEGELYVGCAGGVDANIEFKYMNDRGDTSIRRHLFEGVLHNMERRYKETESSAVREELAKFISNRPCASCEGTRLRREARHVYVENTPLPAISDMSIGHAMEFFNNLKLAGQRAKIAEKILKEIGDRLKFLVNVGLNYLTLSRSAETLSGGEAQRIRLASQIGAGLVGVMYVLDEPSIGLHQRDNERLLGTLIHLRDLGNTVIVVEHDEDAIRAADHVIDIGPGAGVHGGEVVAEGPLEAIMAVPESLTGQYMSGKRKIEVPKKRVPANPEKVLKLTGARGNNLKDVTLTLPVGLFTCITGVSGSGKSTLINDTLFPIAQRQLNGATIAEPAPYRDIQGLEHFDKVIDIDQSPIGRTPRSNPATYTGVFTPVRELFAGVPESRARGYTPGRFSFNVRGGRCEACQGDGVIKVEMHFLPDIYVPCDQCKGKRYNRETLEIKYKGKTIHEVLDMTIEEAREFFDAVPALARKLQTLMDVGLTYIRLGQSATTLSGGEAQRVKLARELSKRGTGQTLYILDEPTTGLHFADIQQLLDVLHKLRDQGNTIVVIEHNLDVIKTADWIVDLGPEGGSGGGEILVSGTPETVAECEASHTARFLKPML